MAEESVPETYTTPPLCETKKQEGERRGREQKKKKEKRNTSKSRNIIICQERPRGVHIFFIVIRTGKRLGKEWRKKKGNAR